MAARQIVVLGGGFAGLWSAAGAARTLNLAGVSREDVQVTLINRDGFHSIRVRNYEADLTKARVPLDSILDPIGVRRIESEVLSIDSQTSTVTLNQNGRVDKLRFDRLVFALGSQLVRPEIPGLAENAFDVDTYQGAVRLASHLSRVPTFSDSAGQWTVGIVGGGLTGIETAAEMVDRLKTIRSHANRRDKSRVILIDHKPWIGSDMGEFAIPVIANALSDLGVETRVGVRVNRIDSQSIELSSGETLPAATTVWCAGMKANPLTRQFPVSLDAAGRLPVDEFLRLKAVPNVFAAGDAALAAVDATHSSVMSCQHGRPMGRFAGHNAACDLLGLPMLPFHIDWYATVLDLGRWGAVYTSGWDRQVVAQGTAAKATKLEINHHRIYPPLTGNREEILAAAAPVVQSPPPRD